MSKVPRAFAPEVVQIPLDKILPSRRLPGTVPGSVKFRQILSSIQSVGVIEPLSVSPSDTVREQYLMLDGHVRLLALQELGAATAPCLVATDDEAYTYNSRINRLSSIQETRMLQQAVAKGVSKERLAKSLTIDISSLLKKLKLLDGICPEAAELLKDRQFSPEISRLLRKMKATRQIDCVALMLEANSLTVNYAEALLATTPVDLLVTGTKPEMRGVTPEQMIKMEREMENLQGQYKLIEDNYADDVLNLVVALGYLGKLLANESVSCFIKQLQPDIHEQIVSLVAINSLDG
jgi:hypothetical protein